MKTLIATAIMLFIKTLFLPNVDLLIWMAIAMAGDWSTGILKSVILQIPRTSSGYRKTLSKFLQYAGSIIASVILTNVVSKTKFVDKETEFAIVNYLNDGLLIYIIYIEVTSIFENLYACDHKSKFSKFIIAPLLKLLTFQIKGRPLNTVEP